jgi:hypothetical protein
MNENTALLAGALLAALAMPAQAQSVEQAMLDFVNDPATTKADLEAAMAKGWRGQSTFVGAGEWVVDRAATAVLEHRAGPDPFYGKGQDDPFDTLRELYDVIGVGGECMEGIEVHVTETGVNLGSSILAVANQSSRAVLQNDVGLDSQTTSYMVVYRDHGPDLVIGTADDVFVRFARVFGRFDTRDHLDLAYPAHSVDAVPNVGPAALQKLHDYALLADVTPEVGSTPATTEEVVDAVDVSTLDVALQNKIQELAATASVDPNNPYPVNFAQVTITYVGATPVAYHVEFTQMIDPEGGIQAWISFWLDESLNVLDSDVRV